ncbi:hypothetical protein DNTS_015979 [Danionella cerebrum]|uniref:Uncharacterized protein n=1 Tax=Danionella cerebrum TaxID=2873325 RepID=A0A553P0S1_9TELE|nr:hypothetical protein DNTS_015979 [Danionella translucida]
MMMKGHRQALSGGRKQKKTSGGRRDLQQPQAAGEIAGETRAQLL